MTNRPYSLGPMGIAMLMLVATQCAGLSTFHQDVAFTFVDTNGSTTFPGNAYDDPPLLDRRGVSADFTAPIAGLYAFVFHVGTGDPTLTRPTHYKLVRDRVPLSVSAAVTVDVLARLTTNGPGFGHALVDLDVGDEVSLKAYNGTTSNSWLSPDANTTNPVVFNGFNVYHRCLCSPLVLRQSAFFASSTAVVSAGSNVAISLFQSTVNIQDEFDETTGVFTAGLPGIYVFMYSFPNQNLAMVSVNLVLNDASVKATVTSNNDRNRDVQYAGTTTVLDLVAGDRVRLIKRGGSITYPMVADSGPHHASPILFSGFLL